MKTIHNYIVGLMTILILVMSSGSAYAKIIFENEFLLENAGNAWVIDSQDDATGNVALQFGNTLGETITFDTGNNWFSISNDLNVTGGITANGIIDFSGVSRFAMDQGVSDPVTCTEGDLFYNTTSNATKACTATNTWTSINSSNADFEAVYATDTDKILTTSNGIFTLAAGSGAVNLNSTGGVSVNNNINGAVNLGTGTSTGAVNIGGAAAQTISIGNGAAAKTVNLGSNTTTSTTNILSGSGGLNLNTGTTANTTNVGTGAAAKTVNVGSTNTTSTTNVRSGSGAVNINASNNQATNINTGTSTGTINLGGGSSPIGVNSTTWDISTAGVASGFTGITTTGVANFSGVSRFAMDQGVSDPVTCTEGDLFYNTTSNATKACTATNTWGSLTSTPQNMKALQVRRTTNYTMTNAFVDITFNTTDLENDPTVLEHDNTNTDRITIKETGLYMIHYRTQVDVTTGTSLIRSFGRIRANDTTVLPGTESEIDVWYTSAQNMVSSSVHSLTANDFISLQLSKETTGDTMIAYGNTEIVVTKLEGVKGDKGDQGAPGSAGLGTDSNTFTLDQDDTGGNVSLRFGTSLNETLTWDNTNSEFDLSDNLDINVNGEVIEIGDGTANDSYINFDDGTNRTFGWDDSRTAFSLSENVDIGGNILTLDADESANPDTDIDIVAEQGSEANGTLRYDDGDNRWKINNNNTGFSDIHMANIFYGYDNAGGQVIDASEKTLNIDTTVVSDSNYTLNADEVTINETGLYRLAVEIGATDTDTSGGARSNTELTLQEDNLGVGSFADIPGAFARCYHRETTDSNCRMSSIRQLDATDIIRARILRINGNTNYETIPGASGLFIERVR